MNQIRDFVGIFLKNINKIFPMPYKKNSASMIERDIIAEHRNLRNLRLRFALLERTSAGINDTIKLNCFVLIHKYLCITPYS